MSVNYQNHLIEEKFVQVKPDELKCVKFRDNFEPNTIKISEIDNLSNKHEFIIDFYEENLYKNQTLLLLRCPIKIEKYETPLIFKKNFIKFLKEWLYTDKKFSFTLTNLENKPEFNFFNNCIPMNKENFFFEGVFGESFVIFRILLSHDLLK